MDVGLHDRTMVSFLFPLSQLSTIIAFYFSTHHNRLKVQCNLDFVLKKIVDFMLFFLILNNK